MMKKLMIFFTIFILVASTLSVIAAADERIHVTTEDSFTHFSKDSAPQRAGYCFDVTLKNGSVYYVPLDNENVLAELSPIFNLALKYEVDSYFEDSDIDIKNIFGAKVGSLDIEDESSGLFSVKVDTPFSFTYKEGKNVGFDDDTHEIDKIFDENGTQLN